MEQMLRDVSDNVERTKDFVKMQITEYAENNAEVYVSSILGLEDEDEKENTKRQYIELFEESFREII